MKPQHPEIDNQELIDIPTFKPLRLIAFVLLLLLGISFWLKWYTGAVSLPRYCKNPADTIHYLEKVLTEKTPAKEEARKPYLIAAKLIYLIPQQYSESVPDYLDRTEFRLVHFR